MKNSLVNLKQTGDAANMNKDLMLSKRDAGEYEYHSVLDVYRKMTFATRQILDAEGETRLMEHALREQLAGKAAISLAHETGDALEALHDPLEQIRGRIEAQMLPPFERKKAGWK